jgi:triosephosphate isomerase
LKKLITVLCQLLVGGTFLFSGLVKAIDPVGTSLKLGEYLQHFGLVGMADLSAALAWVLALSEFALGLLFFFGQHRKMSLLFGLLTMLIFTPLTLYLALYNPVDDCGCFGDAWILTNWQTFAKNVVLLLAIVWMLFNRKRIAQWLVEEWYAFYFYAAMIVVAGLCFIGIRRLPYIDFRPYRPGVSMRQLAFGSRTPSASETLYYVIYEKDGIRREFLLDSIPDESAGWEFVDTRIVEPQQSQPVGKTQSLVLFDAEQREVTAEVLGDTGYVFLLLSPDLRTADEHDLDCIDNLYEYAMQEGYAFYCITLNDPAAVGHWRYRTGAEYPMLFADQQEIETMIRSNPGFMLLHDGVILWKSQLSGIDVPVLTSAKLSEQSYGQIQPIHRKKRVFWIIVWLIAPLFLYLPLQFIYKLIKNKNRKMRKKIVAGNWKMNTTLQEGVALAEGLKAALAGKKVNCDVVVCTPFISVASVVKAVEGSVIGVGAEDCSEHEKGAFTGEVAANMVASTGAKYVILGHSERRQYHGENNAILVNKLNQALANGLTPIFCVGEVKEERENGTFKQVIEGQMEALYTLSAEDFAKVVVAYEPVWAIGTGLTATSEQAQEVHAFIRASIAKKYNAAIADNTSILYGGSCKGSNAPELFAQPDIDGGLIGGAALKVDTFMPIIEAWK